MADPTGWPLYEFQVVDEDELREKYRAVYLREYVRADVRDWNGRRILFHAPTFDHAFSEASRYRTAASVHDVPLSLRRARRILWIKLALAAMDVDIDVIGQIRVDSRGRQRRRRTIIVLENRYVVVLQQCRRDGYAFEFVTAFPADAAYLQYLRRGSAIVERRRAK